METIESILSYNRKMEKYYIDMFFKYLDYLRNEIH